MSGNIFRHCEMMKIGIVFLVVFTLCVIFGNVVENWWDWLTGLVFGISIYQVAPRVFHYLRR